MKQLLFLTLISFLSSFSFAQENDDNFFFKTSNDSLGKSYGMALMPPVFDTITIKKITQYKTGHSYPILNIKTDTIYSDSFILTQPNHYHIIKEYADTIHRIELFQERYSWLDSKACNHNYEYVTETYILQDEHQSWHFEKGFFLNSENWKIKKHPPLYATRILKVVKSPCDPRTNINPAQYRTVIYVKPHKDIKDWQMKNINSLCKKYRVIKNITRTTGFTTTPEITENFTSKKLIKNSRKALIEIQSNIQNKELKLIQKQLYYFGHFNGQISGTLDEPTQIAILDYQYRNNLPIGQIHQKFIQHILSRKTPFNPI